MLPGLVLAVLVPLAAQLPAQLDAATQLPTQLPAPLPAAQASAAAPAKIGPCLPTPASPPCWQWFGRVTSVSDGDTLSVDLAGDRTPRPARVRITGIQAMELRVYSRRPARRRGECHAVAATARLEQLVRAGRGQVRLSAQRPGSTTGNRVRRSVAVRLGAGWHDVGHLLLREGHGLWLPHGTEFGWNRHYNAAAQRAAAAGRGLWRPGSCGFGPAPGRTPRLTVRWNASGREGARPNGEWVRIHSPGRTALPLAGWWLRDSALRRFRFPPGAVVPARRSVTLYVGAGRSTGAAYFWGLPRPAFDNAAGPPAFSGDGAYLFDPHGDLRAWQTYPCLTRCAS